MEPTSDQTVRSMTETIGRPTRLRESEEPLPHIPDYHFVKVIGRGAFGTVWLTQHIRAYGSVFTEDGSEVRNVVFTEGGSEAESVAFANSGS